MTASQDLQVPLFPLNTVIFPGGVLALRIFEPRYLRMVSECMRNEAVFAIALIRKGEEAGEAAKSYNVGTLVRIVDFSQEKDGLLSIVVKAENRFELKDVEVEHDQLIRAKVRLLPDVETQGLPSRHADLAKLLKSLREQLGGNYARYPVDYDNAVEVSHRLMEMLALPVTRKQTYLERPDVGKELNSLAQFVS